MRTCASRISRGVDGRMLLITTPSAYPLSSANQAWVFDLFIGSRRELAANAK